MTTLLGLSQDINALKPGMIALRQALHQPPELAVDEVGAAGADEARHVAEPARAADG